MSTFDRVLAWVMLLVVVIFTASLVMNGLTEFERMMSAPLATADH